MWHFIAFIILFISLNGLTNHLDKQDKEIIELKQTLKSINKKVDSIDYSNRVYIYGHMKTQPNQKD